METKEIMTSIEDGLKSVKTDITKEIEGKNSELVKSITEVKEEATKNMKSIQEHVDSLDIKLQERQSQKHVTFEGALGEALEGKKDTLSNLARTKSKLDESLEIKAVAQMSPANFTTEGWAAQTTDVRPALYQNPFSPFWLRNILPNASTSSASIQYLRENGGEGSAAVWTSGDKPKVDYDFELITENVDWIAGIVRIPRAMLDDVTWLRGYLSQQLLFGKRGLWVAENAEISSTLDANSTAYDGAKTVPVERIYEAAFGQLMDNYHSATHILMNHRDLVSLIALNKAEGSGEYNLPAGSVVVVNGQLSLGGVPVVAVPNLPQGEFMAIDARQTQFINRMSPEVRFFEEDRDNVIKNLITVRAEERVATLVFDSTAVIKGTFAQPAG